MIRAALLTALAWAVLALVALVPGCVPGAGVSGRGYEPGRVARELDRSRAEYRQRKANKSLKKIERNTR